MRAPSHHQSGIYRGSERGASAWPFILTLVLLLVFVWLWYAETEKKDNALAAEKQAKQAELDAKNETKRAMDELEALSRVVGYQDSTFSAGGRTISTTNRATLEAHVKPDGTLPGETGGKGTLAVLMEKAQMAFTRAGRIHTSQIGAEKALDYSVLPQAFKDKLQAYRDAWGNGIGEKPVPPTDEDDVAAMAAYKDEIAQYEEKARQRDEAFADLASDEAWKQISEVVRMPAEWAGQTGTEIVVNYLPLPEGGAYTVEALLEPLPAMIDNYESEITALQAAAASTITQQAADITAARTELDNTRAELSRVQSESTQQIEAANRTITEQTESITRLQDEKSTAQNELEQAKERHKGDITKVEADRDAYRSGLANAKERRDVRIRRDDPKGTMLAVSDAMGTGAIDLGTSDKAYVGMVFVVSGLDRGGNRVDKGRVVVTQVTGPHSSKVRVLEGRGQIAGGDRLHNALYNPTDPIHVYIHGKLDKWPRELAVARLRRLGVIVQEQVDGNTDYVVIPNSLGAKPEAASDEESEDEEGGESAADPLAQLEILARRNGAVIMPERLFDTLLDF
ncbi:MAG: hypothetical protein AB7T63_02975 [Planctomycetota bacterium]